MVAKVTESEREAPSGFATNGRIYSHHSFSEDYLLLLHEIRLK